MSDVMIMSFSHSDGKKMSKRLKNYPDPEEIINEESADALRHALS